MVVREREAIELLSSALRSTSRGSGRGVELGIGDDCAILGPSLGNIVVTNDACLEGVHYRRQWLSFADVAHKALGASVSDVAAMGARVRGLVCHVTLPSSVTRAELAEFARGQRAFCRKHECAIVGGNIASGRGFDVVTTVIGELPRKARALVRSGARVGDEVWLVGKPGVAHLGLVAWLSNADLGEVALRGARRAFARPVPRLREGAALLGAANSGLDVSDGLAQDGGHLAAASGVRLVFDAARLEGLWSSADRRAASLLGVEPLRAILFGGEDYALLATGPAAKRPRFAKAVGTVEVGGGVALRDATGTRPMAGGFEHGAGKGPSLRPVRAR